MKRVLLMATLAVSLTVGQGRAYAFPNNPCIPTVSQRAASGISQVHLFCLLLSALARPMV